MRHLSFAFKNGVKTVPDAIAELGPGVSLGVGLAALISGVNKYYALDVIKHVHSKNTIIIFDELVDLFKKGKIYPLQMNFLNWNLT